MSCAGSHPRAPERHARTSDWQLPMGIGGEGRRRRRRRCGEFLDAFLGCISWVHPGPTISWPSLETRAAENMHDPRCVCKGPPPKTHLAGHPPASTATSPSIGQPNAPVEGEPNWFNWVEIVKMSGCLGA